MGSKWDPLKTSLDVFKAEPLLELAKAGVLLPNAVSRHSEGVDSAADLRTLRGSRRAAMSR